MDLVSGVRPGLPPKYEPDDPNIRQNPYPTYARLRAAGRLCRGGPGQWVVTRYADVAALLTDKRIGNEFPEEYHRFSVGAGPAGDFLRRIVLHQDKPHHSRLRKLMTRSFAPPVLRELRGHVVELVDSMLEPACQSGHLEIVDELAFPLPVLVVCALTGIPPDERDDVRPHAFALGRAFATNVAEEDRAAADNAVVWMRDYIGQLLEQRRVTPGDDMLSRMSQAEDGGERLTHEEIVDNVVFLFFAGFETTTSLITTGSALLLEHPDQLAALRAAPSLIPAAVEEFLRFDAPIQSRLRMVREPVEAGDRVIRPGRTVLLLVGSANRDERQFRDPDRLDISRTPNPHVSFGGGDHFCLGAALARMEGAVVFDRLIRRFAAFQPAGTAVRKVDSAFRTYATIPVAVRPA